MRPQTENGNACYCECPTKPSKVNQTYHQSPHENQPRRSGNACKSLPIALLVHEYYSASTNRKIGDAFSSTTRLLARHPPPPFPSRCCNRTRTGCSRSFCRAVSSNSSPRLERLRLLLLRPIATHHSGSCSTPRDNISSRTPWIAPLAWPDREQLPRL